MAKRKRSWLDHISGEATARSAEPVRERDPLTRVYVLLGLLIVLAIVISDWPVVERFGPNLATEMLGILLTVVFVRRFLEQHERSRRLRASVGALRKARRALQEV
ncbi:MAG TPA: hypothetical protein VK864_16670, partial [Longimicrobiales bacterium]|nr:hypothetical protein [Longimicrobiales bacterium]